MDVIIQDYLYRRSKHEFDASGLDFAVMSLEERERMIAAQDEGCRCFVVGASVFGDDFFRSLRPGTLIARYGVGYDNIPVDLCRERGILVAHTPGVLDRSVSEHAMALILCAARRIDSASVAMRAGRWEPVSGTELHGAVLSVIGFGRLGSAVAEIAVRGFGMKVRAYARSAASMERGGGLAELVTEDFPDAVRGADFVSLHLSSNPGTRRFMNADRLRMLSRDAWLINTARGAVLDEEALFDALKSGEFAGAALDVYEREPYVPAEGKDLRTLPNVIMTPHVASTTDAASRAVAMSCIDAVRNYLEGRSDRIALIPELR